MLTDLWKWQGLDDTAELSYKSAVDSNNDLIFVGVTNYGTENPDDDDSFVFVSGDFLIAKIDGSTGTLVWYHEFDSTSDTVDILYGVSVDSDDDIFVCGFTTDSFYESNVEDTYDIVVMKLDGDNGDTSWSFSKNASDALDYNGTAVAYSVVVDDDDDPIVSGYVIGSLEDDAEPEEAFMDIFIMKLSGDTGDELWVSHIGDPDEALLHNAIDMAIDPDGDLVLAGYFGDSSSERNFLVVKASGVDGSVIWQYAEDTTTSDTFESVAVDADGNIYAAGGQEYDSDTDLAMMPAVLKIDGSTGDEIWTYAVEAPTPTMLWTVGVEPTTGYLIAAGTTEETWVEGEANGSNDFAVVVLDSAGSEVTRSQNGTDDYDRYGSVAFASNGQIFLTGVSGGLWGDEQGGDLDFIVTKLSINIFTTPPPVGTPAPAKRDSEDGLDIWHIALIAVGALLILLACGAGIFCCVCKNKKKRKGATGQPNNGNFSSTSSGKIPTFLPRGLSDADKFQSTSQGDAHKRPAPPAYSNVMVSAQAQR